MCPKLYIALPTQDYLLEAFDYELNTGELRWKYRPINHFRNTVVSSRWNGKCAYKVAGTVTPIRTNCAYRVVKLDGTTYFAHRIIWKMMTGDDPVEEVDHKDTNGLNNRWSNLREATRQEQVRNTITRSNNTTGYKGIRQVASGRYTAQINLGGSIIHLGTYDTAEEAYEVFCSVAREQHGEFFNPG